MSRAARPLRFERRARRPPDLGVLVYEFAKLSETFVLHDLLALEASGVRLTIYSVAKTADQVHHEAANRLQAEVRYLPEIDGRQERLTVRAVQAMLLARDPVKHLRGLARVYASSDYKRNRLAQALLLAGELERDRCPALYVHFAHRAGTIGRFAALMLDIPYAISAHAVDVWTPPVKELRAKVRDAETVLCCYREARDYLQQLAGARTPIALVRHGVELPPPREREEQSPPVVLSVGRLVPKKGYPTLLEAVGLLRDRGVQLQLRIAGEGPEWAGLQRLVNDLGIGALVRFLGPLNDVEIDREYRTASVFALACERMPDGNRDGIPNTVLEAMARGLPVVSTTLPSVAEAVLDGETGLLVPGHDPAALADALERLLGDQGFRHGLGTAGRERIAEGFDRRLCAPGVHQALAAVGLVR